MEVSQHDEAARKSVQSVRDGKRGIHSTTGGSIQVNKNKNVPSLRSVLHRKQSVHERVMPPSVQLIYDN